MESKTIPRKKIAIRWLYTVLFFIIFEILKTIIQVSVYAYKVLRYVTLNENKKPYPFRDFPQRHGDSRSGSIFRINVYNWSGSGRSNCLI
jgi:hypothetical protein